jgi:hypothetical protein
MNIYSPASNQPNPINTYIKERKRRMTGKAMQQKHPLTDKKKKVTSPD